MPNINPTFILPLKNGTSTGTTTVGNADSGFSFSDLLAGEMKELVVEPGSDSLMPLVPKSNSTKDTEQSLLTDLQNIVGQLVINVVPFVTATGTPGNAVPDTSPSEAVIPGTPITDDLVAVEGEPHPNVALFSTPIAPPLAETDEFAQLASITETTLKTEFAEKIPAHFFPKPVISDTTKEIIHNDLSIQHFKNTSQGLSEVQPTTIAPISSSNFAIEINNAANVTPTIHQRVGTPGWDQALGQKINWMVLGGQQSASLTLNPPDLGPLQVVIHVNNQHAEATFSAHQPEVRAALENAIPKLREMLEQSGIQLGDCNVNSQTRGQQEFAQRQINSGHLPSVNNLVSNVEVTGTPRSVSGGIGLVDTFV